MIEARARFTWTLTLGQHALTLNSQYRSGAGTGWDVTKEDESTGWISGLGRIRARPIPDHQDDCSGLFGTGNVRK